MNKIRSAAPVVETTSEDAVTMVLVARKSASKRRGQVQLPSDLERMFAAAEAGNPLPRPATQNELAREVSAAIAVRGSFNQGSEWAERLAGDLAAATD